MNAMIAARQQAQALRRFVEQFGLGQNAPADRHHRVGGQDVGAAQFVVEQHIGQRHFRLGAGQPVGIGARDLAAARAFVDIRRLERVRLDTRLIDQREAPGRTGSEHEFGPADHLVCGAEG
jgi:hypothetical protein